MNPAMQRTSSEYSRKRLSSASSASSGTGSAGHAMASSSAHRPRLFHSNSMNSRPSSTISNSSSTGESSSSGAAKGKFAVSASLLSPSLATALGIHPDGHRRQSHHASDFYENSHSASCTSLNGLLTTATTTDQSSAHLQQPSQHHQRQRKPRGDSFGGSSSRRPSLSSISGAQNRVSVVSVTSFDNVADGESAPVFFPSPAPKAEQARFQLDSFLQSRSETESHLAAGSPKNKVGSESIGSPLASAALMLPPLSLPPHSRGPTTALASPPTSPTASKRIEDSIHSASSSGADTVGRRGVLKRASTEPGNGGASSYDEKIRKRALIVRELLSTERVFVEALQLLHDSFYQPLLARCGGLKGSSNLSTSEPPILSRKAIADIFSNFVDILRLNSELLGRLETRIAGKDVTGNTRSSSMRRRVSEGRGSSSCKVTAGEINVTAFPSVEERSEFSMLASWDPEADTIGDILVPIAPFLKMYSLYVKNFSSALARIESERRDNETFAKFLKDTERSTWGRGKAFFGLGLPAHLLTVVQRIPRYTLLIGELLKNTPVGHRDHQDLAKAFEMVEQVATSINESVRKHEMAMLILSLQKSLTNLSFPLVVPGRALLKRGTLLKACRKDIQARAFFLFTDCIVYARPTSGGGSAAIETAWNAIARAGGIASAGLPGDIAGPWTTTASSSAQSHPASVDHCILAGLTNSNDFLQTRARVSSGNLFSSNAILDALQAAAAHQNPAQLQFRAKFSLQDCTVIGVEDSVNPHFASTSSTEAGGTPWSFEIRTPDKSFAVYADSAASRSSWVNAIREARNEWLQARRTLRAEEDSIEAKRERRRSVVAAAAAARARHSIYSLASTSNPSIPEVHEEGDALYLRSNQSPCSKIAVELVHESGPPNNGDQSGFGLRAPLSLASVQASTPFAALLSGAGNGVAGSTLPLRVLEDYNAPAWVPDSRADRCMSCSESFVIWRRKHHCRLCGRVVCWSCSTRKFVIAGYEEGKEDTIARACDACYESTFPETPDEEEIEVNRPDADGEGLTAHVSSAKEHRRMSTISVRSSSVGSAHVQHNGNLQSPCAGGLVCFAAGSDTAPDSPTTPEEVNERLRCSEATLNGMNLSDQKTNMRQPTATDNSRSNGDGLAAIITSSQGLSLNDFESGRDKFPKVQKKCDSQPSEVDRPRVRPRLSHRIDSCGKPGSVAQALITSSASGSAVPTVQAATSGSGTFRLAPPQITTPDDEFPRSMGGKGRYGCNPAVSSSSRSLVGQDDGYFAGLTISEEHKGAVEFPVSSDTVALSTGAMSSGQPAVPARRCERINSNSSISGYEAEGRLQHRHSKRKPLSAAARLSTYYGNALGAGSTASASIQSTAQSKANAADCDPDRKNSHLFPSPLRNVSN